MMKRTDYEYERERGLSMIFLWREEEEFDSSFHLLGVEFIFEHKKEKKKIHCCMSVKQSKGKPEELTFISVCVCACICLFRICIVVFLSMLPCILNALYLM